MVPVGQSAQGTAPAAGRRFVRPGLGAGFAFVCSLFFLWALANNLNDILIRQFQKALALDRLQASFIQFVFYLGYFMVALPAGMVIRRFGFRAGIFCGLGLYAMGALLFWPAAELRVYGAFLAALFIIASGAAFLETAANPCITLFGDRAGAAQRLNLAAAFNGVGAVLGPMLGGAFIFSGVEHSATALAGMSAPALQAYRASEAHAVQIPYAVLAGAVLLLAVLALLVRLPGVDAHGGEELEGRAFGRLFRNPVLRGSVVAQFCYVGAQVGTWSFFVDFVKDRVPATPEKTAAFLLSASLVGFTIGRFVGTSLLSRIRPPALLALCAAANIVLVAVAALAPGWGAVAALGLSSVFMSIMFPTIFALGTERLGRDTSYGASLLIMAIIGGALLPPLMGWIDRGTGSLRVALLPLGLCYLVVLLFARAQGRRDPAAVRTAPPAIG